MDIDIDPSFNGLSVQAAVQIDSFASILPQNEIRPISFDLRESDVVLTVQSNSSMKGIYRVNDDVLTYCWGPPSGDRPLAFTVPKGSQRTLVRLERFQTGEHAIEAQLTQAGVQVDKDELGWITSLTVSGLLSSKVIKLATQLKKLRGLYLAGSDLTDAGLKQLSEISTIETLQLGDNRLSADGYLAIAEFSKLSSLLLEGPTITDDLIEKLTARQSLSYLSLKNTAITDSSLEILGSSWPQLERLELLECGDLTDSGLLKLRYHSRLSTVSVSKGAFSQRALDKLSELRDVNTVPR